MHPRQMQQLNDTGRTATPDGVSFPALESSTMPHDPQFRAGACWTYNAPQGFEASRILVGAVLTFQDREPIVCCAVTGAPRRNPDGSIQTVTVPFLPMTAPALAATVHSAAGDAAIPEGFSAALEHWAADPRGLSAFTVPFDGWLDRLIARQMAEIAGVDAA